MDVASVEGCKALAAKFGEHEEKLDILVNNGGVAWGMPFEEFPESGWDKVMDLNLKSPFFLTQALHTLLKKAASASQRSALRHALDLPADPAVIWWHEHSWP